jgi:hypothetical protein
MRMFIGSCTERRSRIAEVRGQIAEVKPTLAVYFCNLTSYL